MIIAASVNPVEAPQQRSFASAAKWSYVMDGGRQALTTAITFLLAGLLGPESFGILALALGYVVFVQMLQNQGLGAAIIQRAGLDEDHLDAAFWLLLALSAVLTSLSIGLAGWWAGVNDLPQLRSVVLVLSAIVPIQALVVVQEAVLRRQMDFRALAIRTNVATLVAGVVAVTLALLGAGVWALVTQQLVSAGVGLLLLWRMGSWRPRWSFQTDALRDLLGFSGLNFLATIAVFVTDRADAILVGLFIGPIPAGLYYFASRLVAMIVDFTARALQGATLPEMARLQADRSAMAERMQTILRLSALTSIPVLAVTAGIAPDVVGLLRSEDWALAGPVLSILTLAGIVRSLTLFTGPLLQALGRPGQHAIFSWAAGLISAAGLVIVGVLVAEREMADQVVSLSITRVLTQFVILVIFLVPPVVLLGIRPIAIVRLLTPAVAAGLGAFVLATSVRIGVGELPLLVRLTTAVTAGAVTASAVLWLTEPIVRQACDQTVAWARR